MAVMTTMVTPADVRLTPRLSNALAVNVNVRVLPVKGRWAENRQATGVGSDSRRPTTGAVNARPTRSAFDSEPRRRDDRGIRIEGGGLR